MGLMNDTRTDPEELRKVIQTCETLIPLAQSVLNEAQSKLDRLTRDRDHAKERLWVLEHTYK